MQPCPAPLLPSVREQKGGMGAVGATQVVKTTKNRLLKLVAFTSVPSFIRASPTGRTGLLPFPLSLDKATES